MLISFEIVTNSCNYQMIKSKYSFLLFIIYNISLIHYYFDYHPFYLIIYYRMIVTFHLFTNHIISYHGVIELIFIKRTIYFFLFTIWSLPSIHSTITSTVHDGTTAPHQGRPRPPCHPRVNSFMQSFPLFWRLLKFLHEVKSFVLASCPSTWYKEIAH